jgi:hypothetical protein
MFRIIALLALLTWGLAPLSGRAQSLTGTTSLITVPVAHLPSDSVITFGAGFMNRKYTDYLEGRHHYTPYSASITFLPFLEVSLRF